MSFYGVFPRLEFYSWSVFNFDRGESEALYWTLWALHDTDAIKTLIHINKKK